MQPEEVLLGLLDKASEEISAYRSRQITMFREAIIVQALVTLGVSRLGLQMNLASWFMRGLAGSACLAAGIIGLVIIRRYKARIYHVRDKRAHLVERLYQVSPQLGPPIELFYPTKATAARTDYPSGPSSGIYGLTLILLGVLAVAINILAGLNPPLPPTPP